MKPRSEHKIQTALINFLQIAAKPEIVYGAIPNGGHRHISVAQRLKAEGVMRGAPDLFFCLPEGRMAWLEMKASKGSLSPEQKQFRDRVIALGHLWAMARSVEEAAYHLVSWGVLRASTGKYFPNHLLEKINFKQAKEKTSGA